MPDPIRWRWAISRCQIGLGPSGGGGGAKRSSMTIPGDILVSCRGAINGTLDALRGLKKAGSTWLAFRWVNSNRRTGPRFCAECAAQSDRRHQRRGDQHHHRRHSPCRGQQRRRSTSAVMMPNAGIGTLLLEPISASCSRAQGPRRSHRAGHLSSLVEGHKTATNATRGIQRSDLAEVVLLLHSLGIQEAAAFDWLRARCAGRRACRAPARRARARPHAHRPPNAAPAMHPRYSRMLIEASQRGCVRCALCAMPVVSGRDLLARLDRDDAQTKAAREMFEEDARS